MDILTFLVGFSLVVPNMEGELFSKCRLIYILQYYVHFRPFFFITLFLSLSRFQHFPTERSHLFGQKSRNFPNQALLQQNSSCPPVKVTSFCDNGKWNLDSNCSTPLEFFKSKRNKTVAVSALLKTQYFFVHLQCQQARKNCP